MTGFAAVDPSLNLPPWGWTYVSFSFLIGIAGSLAFLVFLMRLAGIPSHHLLIRHGLIGVMSLAIPGAYLAYRMMLHPDRWRNIFWLSDGTDRLLFRWWSATSLMSWMLLPFVVSALASGILALMATKPERWPSWLRSSLLRDMLIVPLALTGVAMAALPGMVLSDTSLPVWSDSSWWGLVFLLSSLSMAAALLALEALRQREQIITSWCNRLDQIVDLAMLVAFVTIGASLNFLGRDALTSLWGLSFVIATVIGGMLLPNVFRLPGTRITPDIQAVILLLVGIGGFVLRSAVVFAPETLI